MYSCKKSCINNLAKTKTIIFYFKSIFFLFNFYLLFIIRQMYESTEALKTTNYLFSNSLLNRHNKSIKIVSL